LASEKPSGPEEGVNALFYELSSNDRTRILSALKEEELKLNDVVHRLDLTATEAFRQLQRLTEASLIERKSNGKYHLTSYGRLVVESSSSLEFISNFKEYFRAHDAFVLPHELRARLGDLGGCRLVTSNTDTLNIADEMIESVEKRIDATVFGLEVLLKKMFNRLEDGVNERWLMHDGFLPKAKTFLRSAKKLPELRCTMNIPIELLLTEKMAGVTLPLNGGTSSYCSFFGTEPRFLKWANDLFDAEWQKAKIWYP
jgi:predicted transcriptional regulator